MEFGQGRAGGAASGGAGADVIKESSTAGFKADVLDASRQMPVIVDFWAPWCGPCKQLTPVIEKVVRSFGGKVRLVKINIDEHPAIAGQLRVQSIPTVYAFRDGRPIDGFQGALPESQVKAFVERLVGDEMGADLAEAMAEANKLLEAGDVQTAAEIFAAVIKEDRENVEAIAGLARVYMKTGDMARAEQTLSLVPPDKQTHQAVASIKAALDLAKHGAAPGKIGELMAAVEANPADHEARIELAMAHAAAGDKEAAVDQLLESFRRDKGWNEQAARKQLLQLFEAWGPKDPATLDGRRRLSSLLFS
ncbi:MAG: thioredoxin [Hyphomicrobiaceae bacterium]